MTDKELQSVLTRLQKLEDAVFTKAGKAEAIPSGDSDFSGVVGGVRLLLSKGFFDKKKFLSEVKAEFASHDYHYSVQAIQTSLNRFSKPSGPLVAFREGGKKVYGKRK